MFAGDLQRQRSSCTAKEFHGIFGNALPRPPCRQDALKHWCNMQHSQSKARASCHLLTCLKFHALDVCAGTVPGYLKYMAVSLLEVLSRTLLRTDRALLQLRKCILGRGGLKSPRSSSLPNPAKTLP